VLWPDNDASGNEQTAKAGQIIRKSGLPRGVGIILLPKDFRAAGDLVDAVVSLRWNSDEVLQFVKTQPAFEGERTSASECGAQVAQPEEKPEISGTSRSVHDVSFPFLIRPDGIFFKKDSEQSSEPVRISSRIDVVAKTRN
jgi:hypothetical protein